MSKILVHTCCGDCSLKMIDALIRDFNYQNQEIYLYFYNPNIHPESEWLARMTALKQITKERGNNLIISNWQPRDYFNRIQTLINNNADITKQAIRCPNCYKVRLDKTVEYALEHQFTEFTSTMLTSTYLLTDIVKNIGLSLEIEHQLKFVIPKTINDCLHTTGFYKQNYCGCIYSLKQRMEEKYF